MKKQNWPLLVKGDIVDIVAPDMKDGIRLARIIQSFKKLNLVPRIDRSELDIERNTVERNYEVDTLRAILTEDSKAVFFIAGSIASSNILNAIALCPEIENTRKFCIGNSNITSIYSAISKIGNWISIYDHPDDNIDNKIDVLCDIMYGNKSEIRFQDLLPVNMHASISKILTGKIVGGNLRNIRASMDKPWTLDCRNKIVYIEERGENIKELLYMLGEINSTGWFNQAKAVIFGNINFDESSEQKSSQIIDKLFSKINVPVLKFSKTSNITDQPVVMGADASLACGSSAELHIDIGNYSREFANDEIVGNSALKIM